MKKNKKFLFYLSSTIFLISVCGCSISKPTFKKPSLPWVNQLPSKLPETRDLPIENNFSASIKENLAGRFIAYDKWTYDKKPTTLVKSNDMQYLVNTYKGFYFTVNIKIKSDDYARGDAYDLFIKNFDGNVKDNIIDKKMVEYYFESTMWAGYCQGWIKLFFSLNQSGELLFEANVHTYAGWYPDWDSYITTSLDVPQFSKFEFYN